MMKFRYFMFIVFAGVSSTFSELYEFFRNSTKLSTVQC